MQLTDLDLKEILETIPAIILLYKEEIVYVNKYALELTGYKENEVIGKPIWDFCPVHCKDEIKERVLKRIKGEFFEEATETIPFFKKNGDLIYLKSICKTAKINNEYYGLLLAVDITQQVELEKKLKEDIEIFKRINVPVMKVEISSKDFSLINFEPLTEKFYELTGYKKEDVTSDWFFKNLHPKDLKKINPKDLFNKDEIDWEFRFRKKGGKYIWIKEFLRIVERNSTIKFISTWIDITKEKKLEEKLRQNINELSLIFRYSPDIIVKLNKDGIILFKSYATRKLGYKPWDVIGKNIFDYIHSEDKEKFKKILNIAFKNRNKTYIVEYRVKKADGTWAWLEGNLIVPKERDEAFLIERDITDKKKAEEKIFKLMFYDPITSLPNKLLFLENLKQLVQGTSRHVPVIVLKISNLDEFKSIYPESLILNKVKDLLSSIFKNFIIGKTLTNEFLLAGVVKNLTHFDTLLEKFKREILNGIKIDGSKIFPIFNIGISLYPKTSKNYEELLNQAFIALYESLRKGGNQVIWYSKEIQEKFERNEKIIKLLPNSIKNKELKVYYQPIVRLKDRKIIGFETLIRWFSKELGYVPPAEFIPIAEETDFIKEITDFVVKNSIKDISKLNGDYFVSVNFSAKEFEDKKFIENILKYVKKYSFPSKNFVIEITERTAMKDPEYTKEVIKKLKNYEFQIAVDDFGTGYSNMNYLIELDIDKIKIDKDFVIGIIESKRHLNVVRLIIEIAHEIDAVSLAEGIETEKILNKLIELDCDEGQGYLFSPPLPFNQLKNIVGEYNEKRKN